MVREAKVRDLMAAANRAMLDSMGDATADEAMSAYMTMALSAVVIAKRMGGSPEAIRRGVEQFFIEFST